MNGRNTIRTKPMIANIIPIESPTIVARIPTNQPALKGKDAIRSGYQKLFDNYVFQDKYVVKDVNIGRDLAVAHVIWSTVITPKAGGEKINANGNWIINFKKQPDGAWKCIYTVFSDESLVRP